MGNTIKFLIEGGRIRIGKDVEKFKKFKKQKS